MLRSLKDLERYAVSATDGDIGTVVNFLLDDEQWTIRYLVVETDGFFKRRLVLISPISFGQADWSTRHFSGVWGINAYPGFLAAGMRDESPPENRDTSGDDVHLRSANEVHGYHIQGTDDAIGHIDDFIVDDETWQVRYLVIDTRNWWFGKKVLVAPQWADRISWEERKVFVNLSREAIKSSPEWSATAAVNREYEIRLYDYFGRPVYWDNDDRPVPPPHDSASLHG